MASLTLPWRNTRNINYYLPHGLDATSLPEGVKWEDVDTGEPIESLPNQIPTNWFRLAMCDNYVREQASVINFFLPHLSLFELYANILKETQIGIHIYSIFDNYLKVTPCKGNLSEEKLAKVMKARKFATSWWENINNPPSDVSVISEYLDHTICDIRHLIFAEYKFLFHFGGAKISYQLLAHQFFGCETEAEFHVARYQMYKSVFTRMELRAFDPYSKMTQSEFFEMIFPNRVNARDLVFPGPENPLNSSSTTRVQLNLPAKGSDAAGASTSGIQNKNPSYNVVTSGPSTSGVDLQPKIIKNEFELIDLTYQTDPTELEQDVKPVNYDSDFDNEVLCFLAKKEETLPDSFWSRFRMARDIFPKTSYRELASGLMKVKTTNEFREWVNLQAHSSENIESRFAPSKNFLDEPDKNEMVLPQITPEQQQLMESILPDADPEYLSDMALRTVGHHGSFDTFIDGLLGKRDYPTRQDFEKRKRLSEQREKYINGLSMEEFLKEFPDPESVFNETASSVSEEYKICAQEELLKIYPKHLSQTIDKVLKDKNYHMYPAFLELKKPYEMMRKTKRYLTKNQKQQITDERFLKEQCFILLEAKIKDHFEGIRREREEKIANARTRGDFKTCNCCCEEEVLQTEMSSCSKEEDPHEFCNNCIRRFVEGEIGQNKLHFRCLQGECEQEFPVHVLEHVLLPKVYQKLIDRRQFQEIKDANIEDLETCPFCSFAAIMPDKNDKLFHCRAPECMKTSCRLCKELSHIPQSCEENKNNSVRTYMENEMSKAIMRECYKCKKVFVKEDGCNKMRCSCGAFMCYVCKEPIKDYSHFNSQGFGTEASSSKGLCPLWSNSNILHAQELKKRAAQLKDEAGPSAELSYDPETDVPRVSLTQPTRTDGFPRQPRALLMTDHQLRQAFVKMRNGGDPVDAQGNPYRFPPGLWGHPFFMGAHLARHGENEQQDERLFLKFRSRYRSRNRNHAVQRPRRAFDLYPYPRRGAGFWDGA